MWFSWGAEWAGVAMCVSLRGLLGRGGVDGGGIYRTYGLREARLGGCYGGGMAEVSFSVLTGLYRCLSYAPGSVLGLGWNFKLFRDLFFCSPFYGFPGHARRVVTFKCGKDVGFQCSAYSCVAMSAPFSLLLRGLLFRVASGRRAVTGFARPAGSRARVRVVSSAVSRVFYI